MRDSARGKLKFYTESRQVSEVALTERLLCGVEADSGRPGLTYSLRSGWILGQGRPKILTVRNGALADHVHLLIKVPPKISISSLMGVMKGKSAIRVFNKFPELKQRPYWGNHFWASGYCVDTVGLDSEMIKKYVNIEKKSSLI